MALLQLENLSCMRGAIVLSAVTGVDQLPVDCLMAARRRLCCLLCPAWALALGIHDTVQLTSKTAVVQLCCSCF